MVVVFDPLMPQHQIKGFECGYSAITNQNLHRKAAEGADMVIICIPQLYDTARRLAMIHEKHDGITTLVATTEECYNEFSEGLPGLGEGHLFIAETLPQSPSDGAALR